LDENGKKLSKNKLKKLKKKNVLKKMFISGKAVFFDFRFLIKDHLDFLGKHILRNNKKKIKIVNQKSLKITFISEDT
jgi:hypothetical protein